MDKELLKSAFEAGTKYWQDVCTDEPLMVKPVNFDEWIDVLPTEDELQEVLTDEMLRELFNKHWYSKYDYENLVESYLSEDGAEEVIKTLIGKTIPILNHPAKHTTITAFEKII